MSDSELVNCPKCKTQFEEYKDVCPACNLVLSVYRRNLYKQNHTTSLVNKKN